MRVFKALRIVEGSVQFWIGDCLPVMEDIQEQYVLINNEYKWSSRVIKGSKAGEYSDTHLDGIAKFGWLDDNVNAIINFVNETATIKYIYFTFKSGSWLVERLNSICNGIRQDVSSCSIFSPTAKGFGKLLDHPFNKRAWGLAHCWVWNGLDHQYSINRSDYGHLNHEWLIDKGVDPNNF